MKSKIKLLVLLGFMLVSGNSIDAQTAKQIAQIRNEVNLINKNLKKYTKKTKNVENISLEGTEAVFYVSGRGLMKISAKMFGETYRATGEFYYQGEELIFAYFRFNRYDTQIGLDKPPKVVKTEERRFYFVGGELKRLLVGKAQIKSTDERFEELKGEIIDLSGKLKAAYD